MYLDVVALMVETTLSEKSVMDDMVNVELIKQWIAILQAHVRHPSRRREKEGRKQTLETEAVNTTTSYNSPTLFMNWSTPGLLMT